MSEKSITPLSAVPQHVLDVLSSVVVRAGHSLSWYTSKKGRTWLTLKGFQPTVYTTSVEYDRTNPQTDIDHAFMVLLYRHWPKLIQETPPLTTWDTARAAVDLQEDAEAWISTLVDAGIPLTDIYDPNPPASTNNEL